ncbi:hypothetical protein CEV31_3272 [Brucella thiophenivorans]|uniref:Uncharacterized protein n=1 Tax=Brucella thiophenivorans TaxID=571255 RepID=A0A256FJS4_9HYPH|nr:hypothetical protein CEV31_3272 [Brucella thiophenivorans]
MSVFMGFSVLRICLLLAPGLSGFNVRWKEYLPFVNEMRLN